MPPRFRLIPRDERFFDLFARSAQNTHRAAEVLAAMLDSSDDDVDRQARHLDDLEHSGDEVTHAINDAMNRTFVTPLDREDIGNLATALDDVTDRIEEVGRRLKLYRIRERPSLMRRFGRLILEQTEQMLLAVPLLESGSYLGKFEEATQEIHRLENEADDMLSEALGTLYDGVTQVPELIAAMRRGEIYQLLESATDQAEHVAAVLQTIAAKNA